MHALVLLYNCQHTKFEVPNFTDSKDMIGAKLKKTDQVTMHDHAHYLHTKFGDSRSSCSGDMTAGVKIENWSFDPNHTPFRGGLLSMS